MNLIFGKKKNHTQDNICSTCITILWQMKLMNLEQSCVTWLCVGLVTPHTVVTTEGDPACWLASGCQETGWFSKGCHCCRRIQRGVTTCSYGGYGHTLHSHITFDHTSQYVSNTLYKSHFNSVETRRRVCLVQRHYSFFYCPVLQINRSWLLRLAVEVKTHFLNGNESQQYCCNRRL